MKNLIDFFISLCFFWKSDIFFFSKITDILVILTYKIFSCSNISYLGSLYNPYNLIKSSKEFY